MRKTFFIGLLVCVSLLFCACGSNQEAPAEMTSAPEIATTETAAATAQVTTEVPTEASTEAPTEPREIGPELIDGNAVTIENVSVSYLDELPKSIKSSSTYSICGFKEDFILNDSQVYAEIHFTVSNKTSEEIKIADIHDNFLVELIYDNHFVYSSDTNSWCFFKAGSQTAVVSDTASVGSVTLAPLTTKEVVVYMPCAREVSTELDKYLIVVFTSNYSGYENYEFVIR